VRGFLGELFAKSFTTAQLDQPFTESEAETIMGLIRQFGSLDREMNYKGSNRNGYVSGGFIDHGVQKEIIEFKHLMKSRLISQTLTANEGETGPLLMQPVGGMDRIIAGFTRALGERVKYKTPVMSVMVKEAGVEVVYLQDGVPQTITADYCFNCIPAHFMAGIEHNLPGDYMQAMKYIRRGEAIKGAFQAKERFWEKEEIYGGISWTSAPIRQLWYPSHGIHKEKGVILAAYDFGNGGEYTRMSQAERVEWLLKGGEKLHPNYRQLVEKPITIAWHRMNHMLGCSARWGRSGGGMTMEEEGLYHTLQAPALGRHYMIGDQISKKSAWMESAILSAHWAIAHMDQRVRAEV
jgi:monoamine oxidase